MPEAHGLEAQPKTDEELAAAVQSGDTASFGTLMERYEPKLLRYARKFLAGVEDCEDLVQEAFIKAYVNIRAFDPARRFSPWIYRIAHNEFVNAIKKKWRDRIITFDVDELFPHPVAKKTADADVRTAEMRSLLERGLGRIGPKYREPLVLYYLEELEYREIAEILHIPVSTVGVRLKRGRDALKKVLAKDGIGNTTNDI